MNDDSKPRLLEYDCRWYRLDKPVDEWLVDERDGAILILDCGVCDPALAGYIAATIPIPVDWAGDYSVGVDDKHGNRPSVWLVHPALDRPKDEV